MQIPLLISRRDTPREVKHSYQKPAGKNLIFQNQSPIGIVKLNKPFPEHTQN